MKKLMLLLASHVLVAVAGFTGGIYLLPILTAPPPPSASAMTVAAGQALYHGEFRRDLAGSDFLHWGEGMLSVGPRYISLDGKLAPGPDYKLYLSPTFVATEVEFERLKSDMVRVGDVRTFDGFIVALPESVDPADYNTVVIWCEAFSEFITAARYR